MELNEALEKRRSIRRYDAQKPVGREQLLELARAAGLAPSWKNSQTARWRCVLSPELRARFAAECLPAFNAASTEGAALLVASFVRGRSGFARDGRPENELGDGWGVYDLGLATQNLLLRAADLGLGTLVLGIRDEAAIRRLLGIGPDEQIVSVVAVGTPAADPVRPARRPPEETMTFY